MCADEDATKCESSCWRRCEDWRPTLVDAGEMARAYPPSHPPPRPELPFSLAQHNSPRLGDLSGDPARVVGLLTWVSPRIAARLLVWAIVLALDAAQHLWNKRAIARLAPLIRSVRSPTGPKVPPAISTAPLTPTASNITSCRIKIDQAGPQLDSPPLTDHPARFSRAVVLKPAKEFPTPHSLRVQTTTRIT